MADVLLTSVIGGTTSGTVTSVSVVTANGVSGSVATATTTPAITLTLGAITPSSVNSTFTGDGSAITSLNAGNISSGTLAVARGGTGLSSYTANNLVYASGTTTLASLATTANGVLVTDASGVPSISTTLPAGVTLNATLNTVSATVSAAGSTQGTATALTSDFNIITTVAANTGVKLPNPAAGRTVIVVNKGANALRVYPDTSDIIDALSANTHISVPVNGWISFNSISATQWYSTSNATVNVSLASGTLAVANGGTGLASYTANNLIYASGTTTLAGLATANNGVLVTNGSGVPSISTDIDVNMTIGSNLIGYRDIPQNVQNAAYTFALTDRGKSVGKDTSIARTYTIPANGTTAFPVGSAITIFNGNGTNDVTIQITTDTLRLAGTTTTGTRTLAPWGICTIYKVATTTWLISGSGLT